MKLSIGSKTANVLTALAFTGLLFACGPTVKVTTDYDRSANFQQYKTFSLYKLDGKTDAISELNANRITTAVKNEMIKKGFQESSANPDLLVNAVTILKDRKSVSSNTDFYGYGGGYRPYAWGAGMGGVSGTTTYNVQDYKNDWKGTWENNTLTDGTYFYFLEISDTEKYTGYLQIHR